MAENSRQLANTANEVASKAQQTQHNCTAQVATAIHEMVHGERDRRRRQAG